MRHRGVALLLSFVFLFIAAKAYASVEYVIKKGDTLSGIAKKFKVSVRDLKRDNRITRKNLRPGIRITIPVHEASADMKEEGGQQEPDRVSVKRKRGHDDGSVKLAKQLSDNLYYKVRRGDSVASVARKYGITTADLRELNGLRSSRLKKGQRLLVRKIGPKTYVVKNGDTLEKVAKKFDMDEGDLMELNELDSKSLTAGQKLYLEEKVDPETAETYSKVTEVRKFDEEIKKVSESDDFAKEDNAGKLIIFAKKLMNIPYKFGGNSIFGIDCSAYVRKVYGFLGVDLPRTAREQFKAGEAIEKDDLSIGDLVFFRTYASFPSHVGIYLGNNLFIHASSRGKKVTIDSLETPYYLKRFIGAKRLLIESAAEKDQKG